MDIHELHLSPREQKTLETQGFDTVEKIALSGRDDLGLGKKKGDSIIQRARNVILTRRASCKIPRGVGVGHSFNSLQLV